MNKRYLRTISLLSVIALLASGTIQSVAQAQNTVGGGANGASVGVTATVLGVDASVSAPAFAPVTLPSQGGSSTNQLASMNVGLGVPGVCTVLSTGLIVNSTSGMIGQTAAHAESSSTVNSVNVLNGLVTAATIVSRSSSDANGSSATSSGAGSFANALRIAGVLYQQSEFTPNTTISVDATIGVLVNGLPVTVPVSGQVIVNEQTGSGNGTTTSSLTVNFLHVLVSGSVTGLISINANVVVASASSQVNFTAAANRPPVLNLPGPQTVQVGNTLTVTASASDPDSGDTVNLSAANLPANSSFSPNPATGNPASGQLTFTPSPAQAGQTYSVTFTATDNHGATVSGSLQITVTSGGSGNRPPVISVPGPQTVQAGNTLSFTVTGSDPDAGDVVSLAGSGVPPNASFNANSGNPASGVFTFTPNSAQAGQTFSVTFTATDNHGASASGAVSITVTSGPPTNHPPIISVPGPQIIAAGRLLTFTVTASDPDGDAVTLSASGLPANASFNPANGVFSFTPTGAQVGSVFTVTFTATDTHGASANAGVQITVVADQGLLGPPIISVPPSPIIIKVGSTVTFTVTGSSPKPNCRVGLSATDLPAHAAFDDSSGRFTFSPTQDQQDKSFTVRFTATDCDGLFASASVFIIVVSDDGDIGGIGLPGRVCIPVSGITFSPTQIGGGCGFVIVSLSNAGLGTLKITSMRFADGNQFQVEGISSLPISLRSAAGIQLKIMFQPKQKGPVLDTLMITTDDPANPEVDIVLKGKGKQ
jgi:putative Ig domain-containing protein/Big-like domain-containing protein